MTPNHRTLRSGKLPGPLLDRLIEAYRTRPDPAVTVATGYGRDAAAIEVPAGHQIVVKSDPITFASDAAARYLVAVNANDVACLGGIPRWIAVVLLLPEGTGESQVEQLFADLQVACDEAEIAVVGGHTEVTSAVTRPVFIGTLIGIARPHGILSPGEASPGDVLLLTKWAGIEGTALLARELTGQLSEALGADVVRRAAKLLRTPGISVVRDAQAMLGAGGVTALHDPTEGGVATAIHELASASGCGAEILEDSVPVLPETKAICRHLSIDPLGLLASGALLVAARPDKVSDLLHAAEEAKVHITRIGRLTDPVLGVKMVGASGETAIQRFDADEVTRVL
jgi:hydrogenase expression/formation protein HypE